MVGPRYSVYIHRRTAATKTAKTTKTRGWAAVRFSSRKWLLGMVATALAVLIPAGLVWACVTVVAFRTNGPSTVQPGGTVEVFGADFAKGQPVNIHLDSLDGPVLATVPSPMPSTMTSRFTQPVTIPADVSPGQHLLIATQDHYDMNVGIPARATIYVSSSPPAEPAPAQRATALSVSEGTSVASLALIGLGVAAAGLLLAAGASMIAARRPAPGQAEAAKSS